MSKRSVQPHFNAPAVRARRIAFTVSALVLLTVWGLLTLLDTARSRAQFEHVVDQAVLSLQQRVALYRNAVLGLRAAFRASDTLTLDEFARYVDALQVDRHLEGLHTFALARDVDHAELPAYLQHTHAALRQFHASYDDFAIHPPGSREHYHVVELILPMDTDRYGIGYDLWQDERARETIFTAREAGFAVSPPVDLRNAPGLPAIVLVAPVNAHGAQGNGEELDTVAAIVLIHDMVRAALSSRLHEQFHLRILDTGRSADPGADLLFEDAPVAGGAGTSELRTLEFGGRHWQLVFTPVRPATGRTEFLALLLLCASLGLLSGAVTYLGMQRRQRAARVAALAQLGSDCVFSLDSDGVVREASSSAQRITGLPRSTWHGHTLCTSAHDADRERVAAALRHAMAGTEPVTVEFRTRADHAGSRWIAARIANHLHDRRIGRVLVQISDIDARKRGEETIARMAFFDPLTNLPNRRLLDERARLTLGNARRLGGQAAVLLLDLDGFKDVNDEAGHATGDEVLKVVAAHLSAAIRENDTAARLGGDEFVVLLAASADGEVEACAAAQRIATALSEPVEAAGRQWRISASIGIALYPEDGEGLDELLRAADEAMYRIKQDGRDGYALARDGSRRKSG